MTHPITITRHLSDATLEHAQALTEAHNRWAATESTIGRVNPLTVEQWIGANLSRWIRQDWLEHERGEHPEERHDP